MNNIDAKNGVNKRNTYVRRAGVVVERRRKREGKCGIMYLARG